ncbi:unnamed protein product, partial [Porites evermanni]
MAYPMHIDDELIVLSASGTAACIDLQLATTELTGTPHGGILSPVLEKGVVPQMSPVAEPLIVDTSEQDDVCRTKKKEKGEANADIVSTILPFLEYELHQQLLNKLKVRVRPEATFRNVLQFWSFQNQQH